MNNHRVIALCLLLIMPIKVLGRDPFLHPTLPVCESLSTDFRQKLEQWQFAGLIENTSWVTDNNHQWQQLNIGNNYPETTWLISAITSSFIEVTAPQSEHCSSLITTRIYFIQ